jgi:hypothetical protein
MVVPGFDELDGAAAVLRIGANIPWPRIGREVVVERQGELHTAVIGDEI